MAKTISQLPSVPSIDGSEQIEIAQPNGLSPTGFVSRRISASLLGGTMPFRYVIEEQFDLSGYFSFEIAFSYQELIRSMTYSGSYTNYELGCGQLRFNFQSLLKSSGSSEYNRAVLHQSDVFYRKTDPPRVMLYNYEPNVPGGIEMYDLPHAPFNSPENYNNYIAPTNIFEDGMGTEDGSLVVEFTIGNTYGDANLPDAILLRGYVDIVVSVIPPGV